MLKKKRDISLDILKGYAIVLVVVAHVIHYNNKQDFWDNIFHRAITSFHMPLFMFLSGCVAFLSLRKKTNWQIVSQKFIHLVIPFLSWYFSIKFVWLRLNSVNISYSDHVKNLFYDPSRGLWFLWILFCRKKYEYSC